MTQPPSAWWLIWAAPERTDPAAGGEPQRHDPSTEAAIFRGPAGLYM
jgi:hypothetical protein